MESKKIYEISSEEIARIRKNMVGDSFVIDTSKLDGKTKEDLLLAINDVLITRAKEIEKVILGVE